MAWVFRRPPYRTKQRNLSAATQVQGGGGTVSLSSRAGASSTGRAAAIGSVPVVGRADASAVGKATPTGSVHVVARGAGVGTGKAAAIGTVPVIGRGAGGGVGKAAPTGTVPVLGRSAGAGTGKAAPTAAVLVVGIGRGVGASIGRAVATATAHVVGRGTSAGAGKASPSGAVPLVGRSSASGTGRGTTPGSLLLIGRAAATAAGRAAAALSAVLTSRAAGRTVGKATPAGTVGLLGRSAGNGTGKATVIANVLVSLLARAIGKLSSRATAAYSASLASRATGKGVGTSQPTGTLTLTSRSANAGTGMGDPQGGGVTSGSTSQRLAWGVISPYYLDETGITGHLAAFGAYVDEVQLITNASATIPVVATVTSGISEIIHLSPTLGPVATVTTHADAISSATSSSEIDAEVGYPPQAFFQPSGRSPARGAGLVISGVTFDYQSVQRPSGGYTIGAYESLSLTLGGTLIASGGAQIAATGTITPKASGLLASSANIASASAVSPTANVILSSERESVPAAAALSQTATLFASPAPVVSTAATLSAPPQLVSNALPNISASFTLSPGNYQVQYLTPALAAVANVGPGLGAALTASPQGLGGSLGFVADATGPEFIPYAVFQRVAPSTVWSPVYLHEINITQHMSKAGSYIDGTAFPASSFTASATLQGAYTLRVSAQIIASLSPTLQAAATVSAKPDIQNPAIPSPINAQATLGVNTTIIFPQAVINYFQRMAMGGAFNPVYINEVFNKDRASAAFAYINENAQKVATAYATLPVQFSIAPRAYAIVSISWIGGNPSIWDGGSTTWDGGASTWDGSILTTVSTNAVAVRGLVNEIDNQFSVSQPTPFVVTRARLAPIPITTTVSTSVVVPGISESTIPATVTVAGGAVYTVADSGLLTIGALSTMQQGVSLLSPQALTLGAMSSVLTSPSAMLDSAPIGLSATTTLAFNSPGLLSASLEIDTVSSPQISAITLNDGSNEMDGVVSIAVDADRIGYNDSGLNLIPGEVFTQTSDELVIAASPLPIHASSTLASVIQSVRSMSIAVQPVAAVTTSVEVITQIAGKVSMRGVASLGTRATTTTGMTVSGAVTLGVQAFIPPRIADSGLVLPQALDDALVPGGEVASV